MGRTPGRCSCSGKLPRMFGQMIATTPVEASVTGRVFRRYTWVGPTRGLIYLLVCPVRPHVLWSLCYHWVIRGTFCRMSGTPHFLHTA